MEDHAEFCTCKACEAKRKEDLKKGSKAWFKDKWYDPIKKVWHDSDYTPKK